MSGLMRGGAGRRGSKVVSEAMGNQQGGRRDGVGAAGPAAGEAGAGAGGVSADGAAGADGSAGAEAPQHRRGLRGGRQPQEAGAHAALHPPCCASVPRFHAHVHQAGAHVHCAKQTYPQTRSQAETC
jgi:hypothetical protein